MSKPIVNKYVSKLKRFNITRKNRFDIEDKYHVGNKKHWPWKCTMPNCNAPMYPYKQDEYGDIVMTCSNPNCIMSGNFKLSIELKKLLKQQQCNSRLYWRGYAGNYYRLP